MPACSLHVFRITAPPVVNMCVQYDASRRAYGFVTVNENKALQPAEKRRCLKNTISGV